MTVWLLLISFTPTYTMAVSGIASELACHQLAHDITRIELKREGTLQHNCIEYSAEPTENVLTAPMIRPPLKRPLMIKPDEQ